MKVLVGMKSRGDGAVVALRASPTAIATGRALAAKLLVPAKLLVRLLVLYSTRSLSRSLPSQLRHPRRRAGRR